MVSTRWIIFWCLLLSGCSVSAASAADSYVILHHDDLCEMTISQSSIRSYRLLAPVDQIDGLVKGGLVKIDVCECHLLPDAKKCLLEHVKRNQRALDLHINQLRLLDGRMFLFIESPAEFLALYNSHQPADPLATRELVSRLFQLGGSPSPIPPSPPPPPPPNPVSQPLPLPDKAESKCKLEPQVCFKPQLVDDLGSNSSDKVEITAEFELRCNGFPPIIVSTEGKAGIKLGPVEVSVSKP